MHMKRELAPWYSSSLFTHQRPDGRKGRRPETRISLLRICGDSLSNIFTKETTRKCLLLLAIEDDIDLLVGVSGSTRCSILFVCIFCVTSG